MTWEESKHPRGKGEHGGEWVKKLDNKIAKDLGEVAAAKPKIKNPEVRSIRKWNAGVMTSLWSRSTKVERKDIHDAITAQSKKPINIRASEFAIESILKQRRFKNIHERPISAKGEEYLKTRKDYEDQVMGLEGVPAKQRPAYGYVGDVNEVTSYGAYAMTLKNKVRKRTTVSVGDSLNGMLDTHPIDDIPNLDFPTIKGMTNKDNAMSLRHRNEIDKRSYMEAQIHGGLKLSDIESITVPSDASTDLVKRIEAAGITVHQEVDQDLENMRNDLKKAGMI